MSKFLNALKAKYRTPRDVVRQLGLDVSLLNDPELQSSPVRDEPTAEEIVWRHGSYDEFSVPEGSRSLAPKIEEMPEQRMSADDEPDDLEPFRQHLREHSDMSEDEIEQACSLARDHIARRGSNGVDKGFGKDRFPVNATRSSERPAPSRGHFGGERRSGETQTNGALGERCGMDSKARARMGRMFPGLQKIGHEPSGRTSDRCAADAAPAQTGRQRAKMLAMFPDMNRILGSTDVAHVAAEGDRGRGRFEV